MTGLAEAGEVTAALAGGRPGPPLPAQRERGCWHGGVVAFAWSPWPGVSLTQALGSSRTISAFSAVANAVQPA